MKKRKMKKRKLNKVQKYLVESLDIKKVSKLRRFGAMMCDWYISTMLASIPVLYIYSVQTGKSGTPSMLTEMTAGVGILAGILGILITTYYYVGIPLKKNKGQTWGKRIFGIKVVKDDGSNVDAKALLKREIIGVALIEGGIVASSKYFREIFLLLDLNIIYQVLAITAMVIPVVSIMIMIFNKKSKMIHDFVGGTKVVQLSE